MDPQYQISPLEEEFARQIIHWRYQPPYDLYDLTDKDLPVFLNPEYRYHQVQDQKGDLIGYCCFGLDARVPGGIYEVDEPEALDVGIAMHPDLVGKGRGAGFLKAVLAYGLDQFKPGRFRAAVAQFNLRSQRTFLGQGFQITRSFIREPGQLKFYQLEKNIKEE